MMGIFFFQNEQTTKQETHNCEVNQDHKAIGSLNAQVVGFVPERQWDFL